MKLPSFALSQPWRTVLILFFVGAFNIADRTALTAVLPALRSEMSLSDAQLGLLSSFFLWSYALGSPVAGFIGDRFPRRKLVLGSLVVWSTITALTGAASSFREVAVLRVALGFAECIYLPAAVALLAEQHGPATRGRAMSLAGIGAILGSTMGGTLCGVLADQHGWRSGFVVLGLAGIGLAVFARLGLGPAPAPPPAAIAPRRIPLGEPLAYFLATRSYLMILGALVLVNLGSWILVAWLPLYFSEKYHMSMGAAGFHGTFIIAAFALLGIVSGGWLSDRVARTDSGRRLFLLAGGQMLAAPCLVGFVAGAPFAILYVFIALFSFFRAAGGANETPVMCDVVPSAYRATAQGIQNTCSLVAGGLGILLAGVLKREIGLEAIFAGVSIVYLLAAALYFWGYCYWIRNDTNRAKLREGELGQD